MHQWRKQKPAVAVSPDQSAHEPLQQDATETADREFQYPPTSPQLLQTFPTLDEAIKAVLDDAEARQIIMRRGQRFDDDEGVKKVTYSVNAIKSLKKPTIRPSTLETSGVAEATTLTARRMSTSIANLEHRSTT